MYKYYKSLFKGFWIFYAHRVNLKYCVPRPPAPQINKPCTYTETVYKDKYIHIYHTEPDYIDTYKYMYILHAYII